ncbi:MAG: hypothetical protein AAF577_04370 [Pseudomonadota bacterium]
MSDLPPLDYPPRSARMVHQRPRQYRLNANDVVRLVAILSTVVLAVSMVSMAAASTIGFAPYGETTEGNNFSGPNEHPFVQGAPGFAPRLQQIWHVDLFNGPLEITGISFRFDGNAAASSLPLSNTVDTLKLSFGTTSIAPAVFEGSPAFLSGLTLDTVVDRTTANSLAADRVISGTANSGGGVNPFDITINFDAGETFVYDPSLGFNLIMELESSGGGSLAPLDASFFGDLPITSTGVGVGMAVGIGSFAIAPNAGTNTSEAIVVEFLANDTGSSGGGGGGGSGGPITAVPVPPSLALLLSSLGLWGVFSRLKRRRA